MKKYLLFIILLFLLSTMSKAQTGIGTMTPNQHALLDINSGNKGILIPRVNLQGLANPSPIATVPSALPPSLLVFNTNDTAADLAIGYYYWEGSKWEKIVTQEDLSRIDLIQNAGGDLTGPYPDPQVTGIRGKIVAATAPTTNQVLQYNGTNWTPATLTAAPSGTATGDLAGTYPGPQVTGIQGKTVAATAPTNGQVLQYNGTQWTPITLTAAPSGTAAGDLIGTYPNPQVVGIRGRTVAATAPANGQVLQYNGTQWTPVTPTAAPSGTAAGDLTGTYPNPQVVGIRGRTVAATAPTTNQVLQYNGTQWTPATVATATPSGTATGDLSGSYPNPQVAGIQGKTVAVTAPANGQVLQYNGTQWTPATVATATPSGTAAGDLAGTYPNPQVAGIQGKTVAATAPANGQVLQYNGTQWTPTTPTALTATNGIRITTGQIELGNPLTKPTSITSSNATNDFQFSSTVDGADFLVTDNAKVGINTTAPTAKLHVNGTVRFQELTVTSNQNYLDVVADSNGNLYLKNNTGTSAFLEGAVGSTTDLVITDNTLIAWQNGSGGFTLPAPQDRLNRVLYLICASITSCSVNYDIISTNTARTRTINAGKRVTLISTSTSGGSWYITAKDF